MMDEILENSINEGEEEIKAERKKIWSKKKLLPVLLVVFLIIAGILLLYLKMNNKTSQVIKFDTEEVMRVNNEKVVMNEFLLYAADVYQGYNLQNEADWDSEVTDKENNSVTLEKQVKGTICEQIRMTKVLCMKAKDEGITLSDDEKKILLDNAKTYYSELTSANVTDKTLTVDLIAKFYEENALAQKVYNSIGDSYDESKEPASTESSSSDDTELSAKELYFIEKYHDLAEEYNKQYDYYTSINWNLLEKISFAEIAKDDTERTDNSEKDTVQTDSAQSDAAKSNAAQEATQADTAATDSTEK